MDEAGHGFVVRLDRFVDAPVAHRVGFEEGLVAQAEVAIDREQVGRVVSDDEVTVAVGGHARARGNALDMLSAPELEAEGRVGGRSGDAQERAEYEQQRADETSRHGVLLQRFGAYGVVSSARRNATRPYKAGCCVAIQCAASLSARSQVATQGDGDWLRSAERPFEAETADAAAFAQADRLVMLRRQSGQPGRRRGQLEPEQRPATAVLDDRS